MRVVNSPASIPGPRLESRQVLQLLWQAFLSQKAPPASSMSDCSARQVMFVVTNDRACCPRTLNV